MLQTTTSLKREDNLMQSSKFDYKKSKVDKSSGCKAKTTKVNEQTDPCKSSFLNRNFRHSERFKKDDTEIPILRREKSFDATLIANEREPKSPESVHANKMKIIGEQLKVNRLSPLATQDKALRKSLPSLLVKHNDAKDEFQAELKQATSRIKNDLGKVNLVSENITSQKDNKLTNNIQYKPNPTKFNKTKESSLKLNTNNIGKQESSATKIANNRRPVNTSRINESRGKTPQSSNVTKTSISVNNKEKISSKVDSRGLTDRGQASGKESTPEHSPTRKTSKTHDKFKNET